MGGARYGGAITEYFSDSEEDEMNERVSDDDDDMIDERCLKKEKKKTLINEIEEVHALYLRTPKKPANSKADEPSAFDSMNSTFIKQKIILEKPKCVPIWCQKPPVPPAFYERFVTDPEKGIDKGKYLKGTLYFDKTKKDRTYGYVRVADVPKTYNEKNPAFKYLLVKIMTLNTLNRALHLDPVWI
jgi:hypothetical protein